MDIKKGFRVSFIDDQNNDQIGVVIQKWVKKAKIKTDAGEIFYIPIDQLELEPIKKIDEPDQVENDQLSTIVENPIDDQIPFDDLQPDQHNDHPYIDDAGITHTEIYLNPNNLRDQYYHQIENLELTIDQSLSKIASSFYAIGKALHTIKENKLYSGYDSFVDYCFQRWEFRSAYAYNLIAAFLICENLVEAGFTKLPRNESQCRVLASLSDQDQIKVWGIISQQEIITANVIKSEVQKIQKILVGSQPVQNNLFTFQDDQENDNELVQIFIPKVTRAELSDFAIKSDDRDPIGADYLAFKSIQLIKILDQLIPEMEINHIYRRDFLDRQDWFDPTVVIQTDLGDIFINLDDSMTYIRNDAEKRMIELNYDQRFGGDLEDFLNDNGFYDNPYTDSNWWHKPDDILFQLDGITYTLEYQGNSSYSLSHNCINLEIIYYKDSHLIDNPTFWLSSKYPHIRANSLEHIVNIIHDLRFNKSRDNHFEPDDLVTEAQLVIDEDNENDFDYQDDSICIIKISYGDKDTIHQLAIGADQVKLLNKIFNKFETNIHTNKVSGGLTRSWAGDQMDTLINSLRQSKIDKFIQKNK